jgi:hypothetical protein
MRAGGGRVRFGLGWAGLGWGMLIRGLCNGHRIGGGMGTCFACLRKKVGRILQIGLRELVARYLGGGMLRFCGGWLVRRLFFIWTGMLERTAEQHRLLALACKQGRWWQFYG